MQTWLDDELFDTDPFVRFLIPSMQGWFGSAPDKPHRFFFWGAVGAGTWSTSLAPVSTGLGMTSRNLDIRFGVTPYTAADPYLLEEQGGFAPSGTLDYWVHPSVAIGANYQRGSDDVWLGTVRLSYRSPSPQSD